MNRKIEALKQFQTAYVKLVEEFDETINNLNAVSLYPFERSFDEYDVTGWTQASIEELSMLEALKEIVSHNEKQMAAADGDQGQAENLYTIDFEGFAVYDFFSDESLRFDVNPFEYYDREELENVVKRFKECY